MPIMISHDEPGDDNRRMGNTEGMAPDIDETLNGCAQWVFATVIVVIVVFLLFGECKRNDTLDSTPAQVVHSRQ